jgi:ATP-dependent Clp protease adaptor protein ClpS
MSSAEPVAVIKPVVDLQEPPLFKVVYLNDNQTTVDFVIETLISFFSYNLDTAMTITNDIHERGSAVVAVLPFEVAEQKGIEVTVAARNNNFPLQVQVEPDV